MDMICMEHLTKDFGNNKGIFDLNCVIQKGEVFGFLGPNGAGKTTTIRHLMGFLHPDHGNCRVSSLDCFSQSNQIKQSLGYLPGEIAFPSQMDGIEFLNFMGQMRGMKNFSKRDLLIEWFEFAPKGSIKKMSKGMKQKLALICAFMHDPEILILDEPTSGLDPFMQNRFVELILREKKQGKTIFMSSHSFEEIEKTCDRVGILKDGRFAAIETIDALKKERRRVYRVILSDDQQADSFCKEPLTILNRQENQVTVSVTQEMKAFTHALDQHDVVSIDSVSQSLEEIFMGYYGEDHHA